MAKVDSSPALRIPMAGDSGSVGATGSVTAARPTKPDTFATALPPTLRIDPMFIALSAIGLPNPLAMSIHSDAHRYQLAAFEGALFNLSGPTPGDVHQGQAGSCYLLSTMAALAAIDPQAIRNMIQKNNDGSYTVRFYRQVQGNVGENPIPVSIRLNNNLYVDATRDADGKAFSYTPVYATSLPYGSHALTPGGLHETAMWVPIIEKAYALFRGGTYDAMGKTGGYSNEVMASFLGRSASMKQIGNLGADKTFSLLKDAMQQHTPVTIATWTDAAHAAQYTNSGLVPGHAYAMLGVAEREGKRFVTLGNPWGHFEPGSDGKDDGTFELPLDEVMKNFDMLFSSPRI